ncbi:MAG: hypothetical protein QOE82_1606 [Thermoanaerobaculia bacterium]|jgi:hypothetical protein|nr:hypothetical protein [Thermoanaerobaculia bacterium]
MKKLAPVIVLVGTIAGYRYYATNAPMRVYERFAEAILHRQFDAAAAMTTGLTPAELERSGTQEKAGAGPAMFQTLFPSTFRIDSKEADSDGTVTLKSVQTVLFNPVGVESARPAMYLRMNQTVRLRKSASDWKVVSFENVFDKMDSLTGR